MQKYQLCPKVSVDAIEYQIWLLSFQCKNNYVPVVAIKYQTVETFTVEPSLLLKFAATKSWSS